MYTPPEWVTDAEVCDAVRTHWLPDAQTAVNLPVGFGAHHWKVGDGAGRAVFATLDVLGDRHSASSLEAAYAGAAVLASEGVRSIWAALPAKSGAFTVPLARGVISATRWLDGRTPSQEEAAAPAHVVEVLAVLDDLHSRRPPPRIPRWRSRVPADLADQLRRRTAAPWTSGPFGEEARAAIAERIDEVERWARQHLALLVEARRAGDIWVATHGEPHFANQVVTPEGLWLVDWESLALAPRERDLVDLVDIGAVTAQALGAREPMLELFRLDWRLSEIAEYAGWFERPHAGNDDDRTALGGLRWELRS
ncbi:phosphotransferase family protein [Pseudonocardia sp. TRM90224]|uniref:phosphotransferase family protein n=1 Tax=Pseudonocardia sp. TRM90224 TaxID=2812678 RepID=UPI001E289208|nr:phosphotransferase [Pseudonocardia sp. TRM90224]